MTALISCRRDEDGMLRAVTAPGTGALALFLDERGDNPRSLVRMLDAIGQLERGEEEQFPAWVGNMYFVRMGRKSVQLGEARPDDLRVTLELSLADFKDAVVKWLAACSPEDGSPP